MCAACTRVERACNEFTVKGAGAFLFGFHKLERTRPIVLMIAVQIERKDYLGIVYWSQECGLQSVRRRHAFNILAAAINKHSVSAQDLASGTD